MREKEAPAHGEGPASEIANELGRTVCMAAALHSRGSVGAGPWDGAPTPHEASAILEPMPPTVPRSAGEARAYWSGAVFERKRLREEPRELPRGETPWRRSQGPADQTSEVLGDFGEV